MKQLLRSKVQSIPQGTLTLLGGLLVMALILWGCEEPPPCGLISVNSTVHCHSDTPPPPTEELPGHEPAPQPLYQPYQPHQRG